MKLLGPQDITVDSITNTSIMYIRIKALKTDPFRQGVTIAVAVGKSLLASGTCDVSNESALRDSESVGPLSSLAICDATGWKSRCAAINRPLSSCATNGSLLEQARMQWTMA